MTASLIYNSYMLDLDNGAIVPGTDTFYMMLVTATYVPNQQTNSKRSNVTNEVVGTNYTAGGIAIPATVSLTTMSNFCDVTFSSITYVNVTLVGVVAGVIYKHRGGAASADNLVAYVDFGGASSPTGENFIFTATSPLRTTN